ncbi:MAG: hypothetical protein M3041_00970 [Acidobacteriota bacterium]|nr:hypothetical protein [Acidobacteriota bacterium]
MRRQFLFSILFFLAATANAQDWHSFFDAAAFGSYVTETGPKKPQSRLFSTNWMIVGADRQIGRGTILGRARFTLEPLTIPKQGYPQLLQYISPESGGPLTDHMRAHDLVEEVAFGFDWKPIQLYVAPVGEPPLGAEPFAQRASSLDFAEAPFAYDVQESFHRATRVVAAAVTSRYADLEYGMFHESVSIGNHTSIRDGSIDSWSARLTIAPESKLSAQLSTGRLGDAKRKVTSGSISYRGAVWATSGIWTKLDQRTAYSLETTMRYWRSTLMARGESVDRPAGIFSTNEKRTTHLTVGYIFDVFQRRTHRAGVGIDIDYHVSTKALEPIYGHKPQTIYTFVRWRTEGITRPTSP